MSTLTIRRARRGFASTEAPDNPLESSVNQTIAAAVLEIPAIPTEIGTPFAGGFYNGRILVDGREFALITAGAGGELKAKWSDSLGSVAGATHRADGLANTKAMAEAGSELAKQALALVINGFNDWYIPSRDEQELQYRAFKPTAEENYAYGINGVNPSSLPVGKAYTEEFPLQTTVENFREGGADALTPWWYWSSTQREHDPTYAWGQNFGNGDQYVSHKSYAGSARAVRILIIQ